MCVCVFRADVETLGKCYSQLKLLKDCHDLVELQWGHSLKKRKEEALEEGDQGVLIK